MADRLPLSDFRFDHYMTDINQCESFFLQSVCEDEIRNLINILYTHKATGPDDIPVLVLKNCRLVIALWLAKLINDCFVLGVFPGVLKRARITPLFKSGYKSFCNNYHPISTLSHIAKVFERLVHVRLSSFLEKNNILSNFQLGFRPAHSTQYEINYLHEKFVQALDNKEHVVAVFLDLSKAFDTVNHEILLCKLQKYGVFVA